MFSPATFDAFEAGVDGKVYVNVEIPPADV
jgi:hypothetical protein